MPAGRMRPGCRDPSLSTAEHHTEKMCSGLQDQGMPRAHFFVLSLFALTRPLQLMANQLGTCWQYAGIEWAGEAPCDNDSRR